MQENPKSIEPTLLYAKSLNRENKQQNTYNQPKTSSHLE